MDEYTFEFYHLLEMICQTLKISWLSDTSEVCDKISKTLDLFDPISISEAYQEALQIERRSNRHINSRVSWARGGSGSASNNHNGVRNN